RRPRSGPGQCGRRCVQLQDGAEHGERRARGERGRHERAIPLGLREQSDVAPSGRRGLSDGSAAAMRLWSQSQKVRNLARTFLVLAMVIVSTIACARKDWIDRTLVTENVSGAWSGSIGSMEGLHFDLRQQGARVTGSFQTGGFWASWIDTTGAINGSV